MTMRFFGELVVIKKIRYEGNIVKFFITESGSGFLFTNHHITELDVPTDKVDDKLLKLLKKSPNYELENVEMVLEGRSTSISELK
ncbi:MAG: hypothetical protein ACP5N1_06480 [Candidatus Woesearchaeota archaeon]